MTASSATKEIFMETPVLNPDALPWLADAKFLTTKNIPAWVKALRATGAEQFSITGLPTPALEGWQYTNLRALTKTNFHYSVEAVTVDAAKIPPVLIPASHQIVLVNGRYQPALSRVPDGVIVTSWLEAAQNDSKFMEENTVSVGDMQDMPLKGLNTAYLQDGLVVKIAPNTDVSQPLEIVFYNNGGNIAIYPRLFYYLGENSGATIIERHIGEGVYFVNLYTETILERAARLKFYKFQEESAQAFHFSLTNLQQKKDSVFEGFSYATGGAVARSEYRNHLLDSAIHSNIGGVYLLRDQQIHDFTILVDHFEPNGTSVQHFKGIIDDEARAIFQGKIHVRRSAQKTNGYQLNHALLLSREAEAIAKPELEIYADDVKCSHGSASGQIDEAALFYLKSRGINEAAAKSLLIQSFLAGALEKISTPAIKEIYQQKIEAWLEARS
jgi:Fe-S cluster assembly protein SufD